MKKTIYRTLPNFHFSNEFWVDLLKREKGKEKLSSQKRFKNFKDVRYPKIILFLSLLYNQRGWKDKVSPLEYVFVRDKHKMKSLSSKALDLWMGTRQRKPIIDVLNDYKYIEVNDEFIPSNSLARKRAKSKSYRIHPKWYDKSKVNKHKFKLRVDETLYDRFRNPFDYLEVTFGPHVKVHDKGIKKVRIDESMFKEIWKHLVSVNPKLEDKERDHKKILHKANKAALKSFKSYKRKSTGQRIYNDLQRLPKELRYAFDLGEEKAEVEIRNAVPFFFGIDMVDRIFSTKESKKIKSLINNKRSELTIDFDDLTLEDLHKIVRNILSNIGFDDGLNYFLNEQKREQENKVIARAFGKNTEPRRIYHHSCSELHVNNIDILVFLIVSSFGGFYKFTHSLYKRFDRESEFADMKKKLNRYFNSNSYVRKNIGDYESFKVFEYYFPNIEQRLQYMELIDQEFFIIMQNKEALLMLENVFPEFAENYVEPFVGIHDGVICRKSSSERMFELIEKHSLDAFGLVAPVSIREIENPLERVSS